MKLENLKRTTEIGNSYWDENGAYSNQYKILYDELVLPVGNAPTINGELLRCGSRLNYEYFNNGNCNAVDYESNACDDCLGSGYADEDCTECQGEGKIEEDTCLYCEGVGEVSEHDCSYCDGEGVIEGDLFITDYYAQMFDFLEEHLEDKIAVDSLKSFLTLKQSNRDNFNQENIILYNNLMDSICYQVIKNYHSDKPNKYYTENLLTLKIK